MVGLDARFSSLVNTGRSSLVNIVRPSLVKSTPVSDMTLIFEKHKNRREHSILGEAGRGKFYICCCNRRSPPAPHHGLSLSSLQIPGQFLGFTKFLRCIDIGESAAVGVVRKDLL